MSDDRQDGTRSSPLKPKRADGRAGEQSGSFSNEILALVQRGLAWNAEQLGNLYASAARTLLERKEALEDLRAESRHQEAAPTLPAASIEHADGRSADSTEPFVGRTR
jgi:hypothetical protein